MTAEQIRRRRNARTVLWSLLGALAISALAFFLYHSLASAGHCAVWDPYSNTCSVPATHTTTTIRPRPTYAPTTSPIPATLPPTTPTTEYFTATTTPTTSPPTSPPDTQPPATYAPATSPIPATLPSNTTPPPRPRPPTPPPRPRPSTSRPSCEHQPQGCPTSSTSTTTTPPVTSFRPVVIVVINTCSEEYDGEDCEVTVTFVPAEGNNPHLEGAQQLGITLHTPTIDICWNADCDEDDDGTPPPEDPITKVCDEGTAPGPNDTCIEICPNGQHGGGGGCHDDHVCPSGYVLTGHDTCVLEPCSSGQHRHGGGGCHSATPPPCPSGQVLTGDHTCDTLPPVNPCPSGQHQHPSGCHSATPPPCPSGQVLTGHHTCQTTTTRASLNRPPITTSPGTPITNFSWHSDHDFSWHSDHLDPVPTWILDHGYLHHHHYDDDAWYAGDAAYDYDNPAGREWVYPH